MKKKFLGGLEHVPADRLEARHAILAAANKSTQRPGFTYRMRHLQDAVCMVRRKRLVAGEILVLAGYNEVER